MSTNDLENIFLESNRDNILFDLENYYNETMNSIDFNEIWSIYSKNRNIANKYRFNKITIKFLVIELKEMLKPKTFKISKNDYTFLLNRVKNFENPFTTKTMKAIWKKLLLAKQNNLLVITDKINSNFPILSKRLNHNLPLDILDKYNDYITSNDISDNPINQIYTIEQYINKKTENNDITSFNIVVNENFNYIDDIVKKPLYVDLISKKTLRHLRQYEITIDDLEFISHIRHLIKTKQEITNIALKHYRELLNKPILLIDSVNLSSFYDYLPNKQMYENQEYKMMYALDILHYKHNEKHYIEFIKKSLNTNEIREINHLVKTNEKKYVKLPRKRNLILFAINDKDYNDKYLNDKIPKLKTSKNSYNIVLNRIELFNIETLDYSKGNNRVNLLEQYYNKNKWYNTKLFFGFKNTILNRKPIKVKDKTKNIIDNPKDFIYEQHITFLNRELDNKHYGITNKRIVVINNVSNEKEFIIDYLEQYRNFTIWFKEYIDSLMIIFSNSKHRDLLMKWLNDSIDIDDKELNDYLTDIFENCFYPYNVNLSFNNFYINHKKNIENLEIMKELRDYQEKHKSTVKIERKVNYRKLQKQEYINQEIKRNESLIDKWFISLSHCNYIIEQFNTDMFFIPLDSKTYYYKKIIAFYNSKLKDYKLALRYNMITLKDFKKLQISLKSHIKTNAIYYL